MSKTVNLIEAQGSLPELADEANAGQTIIVANEGQELAVIMGIEEYRRLKNVEEEERGRDFGILLIPPDQDGLSEEEARRIAVEAVREYRITQGA
ncbi:MAG: Antitoxin Phd YefM, type toxin-antitoxin system [Chloroflexia bacterium]|jgi:prevent-host-death family protein|nr:Antitoxin Phd YefM, type toxin-antitoxin system [Chloroflexia bacterium]